MSAISIKVKLVNGPSLANRVMDRSVKDSILRAMGAKLKWLTVQNFGSFGTYRPTPWKLLSKCYAKKVGRTEATLDLTGELMRSLRVGSPNGESIEVYTDDPKASYHQFGEGHNPKRPFFPITDGGDLTPRARAMVETAAQLEAQRILRDSLR